MKLTLLEDKNLPDGVILYEDENDPNNLIFHPNRLIRQLHDLQFSIKEKILQAQKILHARKNNLSINLVNFFSDSDKKILCKLGKKIKDNDLILFFKKIVNENKINYKDNLWGHYTKLSKIIELEIYDRKCQNSIASWYTFRKDEFFNKAILENIINNQLHTSFPAEFNDIFDSQLRSSEKTIKELSKGVQPLNNVTKNGLTCFQ